MARIAAVQHGDYAEAHRIIGSGQAEPYFGMAGTLRVLGELFGTEPHLVVSLDAPSYRVQEGAGQWIGLPCPRLPRPIPRSVAADAWGRRIVREVERFSPTHVLLRSGGRVGRHVLEYCVRNQLSTLVVYAQFFSTKGIRDRRLMRQTVRLLNHPCVRLVGNHKRPATASMVEHGVEEEKCVAWDWPGARHPRDFPTKRLPASGDRTILYVGAMVKAKGVSDLIDAVGYLLAEGRHVRLLGLGGGADLEWLRAHGRSLPGAAFCFPGRASNEEAFAAMREATLVCVPSRHEFTEGLPLTLTEALASRTPAVISDHPVLQRAFVEGEGVRFSRASDPRALSRVLGSVLDDPAQYERLSATTLYAFRRVECSTSFGDLVLRWRSTFG